MKKREDIPLLSTRDIREMMVRDFGLTRAESKILIHNYGIFSSSESEV